MTKQRTFFYKIRHMPINAICVTITVMESSVKPTKCIMKYSVIGKYIRPAENEFQ